VLELAGVRNVLAKSLGTTNPINMAKATMAALYELRRPEDVARIRGKQISEVLPLPSIKTKQQLDQAAAAVAAAAAATGVVVVEPEPAAPASPAAAEEAPATPKRADKPTAEPAEEQAADAPVAEAVAAPAAEEPVVEEKKKGVAKRLKKTVIAEDDQPKKGAS
jgi:hypothetical protein